MQDLLVEAAASESIDGKLKKLLILPVLRIPDEMRGQLRDQRRIHPLESVRRQRPCGGLILTPGCQNTNQQRRVSLRVPFQHRRIRLVREERIFRVHKNISENTPPDLLPERIAHLF